MRSTLLVVSLLALATAANAEPRRLSVTIYNSDLALVEDVRTETLTAGRQRIEFKDVSPQIRAETVSLSAPGVGIVEQNFDYDLLSPDVLMQKAVGQDVKIVRTNPGTGAQVTETATVLAVNGGVVLKIGDRIEVLRDDGLPTRVIFDKVPDNLRARPTLSVTVDAAKAGPREARLSYLTRGLGWKADYVALFDEKVGKLDLQGWITLTNTSGTAFEAADVKLVAGSVGEEGGDQPPRRSGGQITSAGTQSGSGGLADYYLYPLAERTTIAQNQTKQVSFLDIKGAAARKIYSYQAADFASQDKPASARVILSFTAAGDADASAQLPAGVVRVYVRDTAGDPKFVGENSIPHTPRGSELSVGTGDAFDVTVLPTLVARTKVSDRRTRYEMKYLIRNARPTPAVVKLEQSGMYRSGKVITASQPATRTNASSLAWDVNVPANGETTLTFTVEDNW